MKKEYTKPTICVVNLMISNPLLVGSGKSVDSIGDYSIPTYQGEDEIIYDDDVL